jgi:hypothetical protein
LGLCGGDLAAEKATVQVRGKRETRQCTTLANLTCAALSTGGAQKHIPINDTGFLLALVQPADALHARAVAWARVLGESLLVTGCVPVETVNNLYQKSM